MEPNTGHQFWAKRRFGFLWCCAAKSRLWCCTVQQLLRHKEVWGSCGEKTQTGPLHITALRRLIGFRVQQVQHRGLLHDLSNAAQQRCTHVHSWRSCVQKLNFCNGNAKIWSIHAKHIAWQSTWLMTCSLLLSVRVRRRLSSAKKIFPKERSDQNEGECVWDQQ